MAQEIKILGSTSNTPTSLGYRQPAVSFTGGKAKFYVGDNTDTAQQINSSSNVIGIAASTSNAHQSVVVKEDGSGFEARNDVPTYTTTARDALTNVPTDFIIYNSTAASFQKYNGSSWASIGGGGGGGSAVWGDITGTLSDQTDLQSALDAKQDQDNLLDSISSLGGNGVIRKVDANTAESVSDAEVVEDAINGATAKTSLVDADLFGIIDSAAANVLKKITWANIKATLKTYFDGFYLSSGDNTVTQSTTTRTLALTDAFKYIRCTNASATTITVPTNASVAFPIGTQIDFFQAGTGQVSFVAAGGVTINYQPGLKISVQYKGATLIKVGTNTWDLIGSLSL